MEDTVVAENLDKSPENPTVTENLPENPQENSENLPENPPVKKNGRPAGSKDKVKRATPSRKKITIVEEPLAAPAASSSAPAPVPEAPKAKAAPKPKVQINPEPVIQYVDRVVEHSPRSLMSLMSAHAMDLERAKKDARRDHFSNAITSRLRQLP
jgi:hypothetical protein